MANQVGKRHVCAICGSEMLVTRGGEGRLACCDQPMQLKGATTPAQVPAPAPVQSAAPVLQEVERC
ncbi:MAG: hypothetical protein KGJ86_18220 [Chloroflexota bacterium]|nr:hypothetical protein [Chloroflexota bacterium]